MAGERVLIVDDDQAIRQMIGQYLQGEGFETLEAEDGEQALTLWRRERPDLMIVDWMMPRRSGLDLLRQIRQEGRTPVIMLTARSEESDLLLGLELGADDYLTKPFRLRELAARMRAVLRRAKPEEPNPEVITYGEFTIDLAAFTVQKGSEPVALTPTEFKLMAVLARNPNRVFSRLQLMEKALGDIYDGFDRTVDSHISHLRAKLGDDSLIQTVKGVGFKLVPPGR